LKPRSLRSNQFLLLGRNKWLSKRPLLPLLLQQEALFRKRWLRKAHQQRLFSPDQTYKLSYQHLPQAVKVLQE
jgi:hypothetical protein